MLGGIPGASGWLMAVFGPSRSFCLGIVGRVREPRLGGLRTDIARTFIYCYYSLELPAGGSVGGGEDVVLYPRLGAVV